VQEDNSFRQTASSEHHGRIKKGVHLRKGGMTAISRKGIRAIKGGENKDGGRDATGSGYGTNSGADPRPVKLRGGESSPKGDRAAKV